jgi:nicotinate (nicotinamide) nucleotide adenylyltransferase
MAEIVAVLGGTFDPIHSGHVSVLQQVSQQLNATQSWLLVAGQPNLRSSPATSVDLRLRMAQAAAAEQGWKVCDVEARRSGPSYTLDTVVELRAAYPELQFQYVIGADAARQIQEWHRWQELLAQTNFVIINRAGVDSISASQAAALGFDGERTNILTVDSPPVSATDIRVRVRAGQSITDLVPSPVADLVAQLGVYR